MLSCLIIKRGEEIHGPEDAMYIEKDNVLYWENLKADGKVAQSIIQHKVQQTATAAAPLPTPQ